MDSYLAWFAVSALIAVVVAGAARQRGWGMALPVLAVGAVVGAVPIGPDALPDPELFLIAILAPLVFGEALGSSYLDIRRVSRPVLALAIGLVVVSTLVVGAVAVWIAAMPIAVALALGAVLAPTDAVAVSTVARKASLPRGLVSILEGESLVNDGTGLTALRVAIVAAAAGSITLLEVSWVFALAVVFGVAVGFLGGWILSWVIANNKDAVASNSLVLVAPFALYLGAEHIGGSGILAVVVAALYTAHSQTTRVRQLGRLQSASLWRHVTFVLQSMAFYMVGLQLVHTLKSVSGSDRLLVTVLIPVTVLVLIITRVTFVMVLAAILGRRQTMFGRRGFGALMRGAFIVGWAGARGPVSALAAFSIPLVMKSGSPFPFRDVIVATTFGTIVITLLLSQTMAPLARRLRVQDVDGLTANRRLDAALAYAALKELDLAEEQAEMTGQVLSREAVASLRTQAQTRINELAAPQAPDDALVSTLGALDLARLMVRAEQEELLRIRDEEGLPDSIVRPMQLSLDMRQQALTLGQG